MSLIAPAVWAAPGLPRAAEPNWVTALDVDFQAPTKAESGTDSTTLLLDSRVRVEGAGSERYERRVRRALTAAGVERLAQLLIEFDPERQRVHLHRVQLRRGSQVIDQTRTAEVRVVAQESELERRIYNGDATAFVVLNDVRVGDVLDVSYSVISDDQRLGNRFASYFRLSHDQDRIQHRHVEILPQGKRPTLRWKIVGQAVETAHAETPAFTWDLHDVAPDPNEDRVPTENEPPWLEVSEYQSWQEVATWGEKLYPELPPDPSIRAEAKSLVLGMTDPEGEALSILRFVQDQVRYLGIQSEGHAFRPHSPSNVLAQRFGDCKDKTYLLMQLLAARGISARPLLVNTDDRAYVNEHLPTPYAFDHVILRARVAGKVRYLDATYAHQGGTLDTQIGPDFGYGLVLSHETTALEALPETPLSGPNLRNLTRVNVATEGSATVEVTTHLFGDRADAMRSDLEEQSLRDLGERYANYYQHQLPELEIAAPLEAHDDRQQNHLVLQEHYRTPKFWRDGGRSLFVEASASYLKSPRVVRRSRPLDLSHPVWLEEAFEVALPFHSKLETDTKVSRDGAMSFKRSLRNTGAQIEATFEYRSLAPVVKLDHLAEHLEALSQARIWDSIDLDEEPASGQSRKVGKGDEESTYGYWIVAGVLVVLLAIPAARALRNAHRRRSFRRRRDGERGDSPARPTSALSRETATARDAHLPCKCGQTLGTAPVQWTELRYQGATLHAARRECPSCGEHRRRYYTLSETEFLE